MSSYRTVLFHCTAHGWYDRQHFFQALATAFARRGKTTLYVSRAIGWPLDRGVSGVGRRIAGGYLSEESGLHVVQPIVPNGARFWRQSRAWRAVRESLVTRAALAAMAELGLPRTDILMWCYGPDALSLLRRLPGSRSIYWTGDDRSLPGEDEILKAVDHVFTACPGVLEDRRADVGDRAAPMPMAVEPGLYGELEVPDELKGLARPLVGYAGELNARLDFPLLQRLARETSGTLVLVGPAHQSVRALDLPALLAHPNVRWVGHKGLKEAPAYIRSLDVGLLPYARSRFNDRCNPTKFYEYLAAGLPVVSTAIPLLRFYEGLADVAENAGEFVALVRRAGAAGRGDPEQVSRRRRVAENHSYDRLISLFDRHLDGSVSGLVDPATRWCEAPR